jgi:hypothetical protein
VTSTTEELAEFQTLSAKVSDNTASEDERHRWRQLRARLAPASLPPPAPTTGAPLAPMAISPSGSIVSPAAAANARQHSRTSTRKLKVAIAPVTTLHSTFTEEVSPGGVKLKLPMHVEPGAPMVVRLELGLPGPILVSAKVAWCRRDGGHFLVGLSFVGLRDDERERIEAWTTVNATPPGAPAK